MKTPTSNKAKVPTSNKAKEEAQDLTSMVTSTGLSDGSLEEWATVACQSFQKYQLKSAVVRHPSGITISLKRT